MVHGQELHTLPQSVIFFCSVLWDMQNLDLPYNGNTMHLFQIATMCAILMCMLWIETAFRIIAITALKQALQPYLSILANRVV